jgi:hypothetical protein
MVQRIPALTSSPVLVFTVLVIVLDSSDSTVCEIIALCNNSAGDWTQSLHLQALHHLACVPTPSAFSVIFR